MFDFTGPVNVSGPIHVTNQVPDNQIAGLVKALEENTQAVKELAMAKKAKLMAELEKAVAEMEEVNTVKGSVNLLVDRLIGILDSDDDAEAKVAQLRSGLASIKTDLSASVAKGTAAADEEEAQEPTPEPEGDEDDEEDEEGEEGE